MSTRQEIGKWGETVASEYLTGQGFTILERNVRTPYGEIDLIARLGDLLVFVEVKARTSHQYGYPEEAITYRKQAHLRSSVEYYIQESSILDSDWRVDAISIEGVPGKKPIITHFENVI